MSQEITHTQHPVLSHTVAGATTAFYGKEAAARGTAMAAEALPLTRVANCVSLSSQAPLLVPPRVGKAGERETGRGGREGNYLAITSQLCTHILRMRALHCACVLNMCDEGVFSSSEDLKELMRERSKFISRYQWIWDVQMTKFFQQKYWNNIPTEV